MNGTYNPNDCVDGIVQLKFANGIPVKPNVEYALACRTSQGYAGYGFNGLENLNGRETNLNGPDGTKFDFTNTKYFHGTTENRFTTITSGQVPQILYCTETGTQIQVSFNYFEQLIECLNTYSKVPNKRGALITV